MSSRVVNSCVGSVSVHPSAASVRHLVDLTPLISVTVELLTPLNPPPIRSSATITFPPQLHSETKLFQLTPPQFFLTRATPYSNRPTLISMPLLPPPSSSIPRSETKSESEVINYANGSGSIMQKYYYDDSRPRRRRGTWAVLGCDDTHLYAAGGGSEGGVESVSLLTV